MKLRRYTDANEYQADVLDFLLEDEVRNNLPISILVDGTRNNIADWLMATVTDDFGSVLLVVLCTKPFPLLICKRENVLDNSSVVFLAKELRRIGFEPPGILAIDELAGCFAETYCGGTTISSRLHMTMVLMRLDRLSEYKKASGFCRMLQFEDLSYTPAWENAFCVECRVPIYTLTESEERIKKRLGMNVHYIWEDGKPVAQAVFGRNTPNGAAISWVYTPSEFRGFGYATSVVAELSKNILEGGKSFCCLFADASNPASCAVYHKLGYYDICKFSEIKFDMEY